MVLSLLNFLEKVKRTTVENKVGTPLISVIIPCYNGEKYLLNCLFSILEQDYKPIEIIAIDDASSDKTYDLLSTFKTNKALKIIKHERNLGLAATYNQGLEISRGDFVLLLHQDCMLGSKDWLSRAIKHFTDTEVAVVTGRPLLNLQNMTFVQKAFTFLRKTIITEVNSALEVITFFEGKCDLCRKDVLINVGGFPSHKLKISGEDQWVSYAIRQKKYKIIRDQDLTFRQEITKGLYTNFKKELMFGKTQGGLTVKYGLFQLSGLNKSTYMKTRAINKLSKLATVLTILVFLILGVTLSFPVLVFLSFLILISRILFFTATSLRYVLNFTLTGSFVVSILGIITDFIYFFGYAYGLFLSIFGRKL